MGRKNLVEAEWRDADFWGVSPEIEFFLAHAIRIEVEHYRSPWNAIKGVAGRDIRSASWQHAAGGRPSGEPETRPSVVLFPDAEAEEWIQGQWCEKQAMTRLAVVTADEQQYLRLTGALGAPRLIVEVAEKQGRMGMSEVLYTSREVEVSEGRKTKGLPEKGALLVWQREGDRGISAEWDLVLDDLRNMARAEGAGLKVKEPRGGLEANPRYLIFHRPLEEDLQWLQVKRGQGRRAVYRGSIPCHIGSHWPWVSYGDAGSSKGVTYTAMVTDLTEDSEQVWKLPEKPSLGGNHTMWWHRLQLRQKGRRQYLAVTALLQQACSWQQQVGSEVEYGTGIWSSLRLSCPRR